MGSRPALKIRNDLAGIFGLSLSILAFELVYAKIVHVQHYGNLGYVVIGTALFGFALAGVLLSVNERLRAVPSRKLVPIAAYLSAVSMLVSLLVTSVVPLNFLDFFTNPVQTVLYLAIWYLGLTLPFFFGGLVISSLLDRDEKTVSRLYGADLIGAGLGAAAVLPLIAVFGGVGIIWIAAALGVLSALIFSIGMPSVYRIVSGLTLVVIVALSFIIVPKLQIVVHTPKRGYAEDRDAGRILTTQWSALSRIDIADRPDARRIWFDGGSMQSHMFQDDGTLTNLPEYLTESSGPVPYMLRPRNNVLIIASAGGGKSCGRFHTAPSMSMPWNWTRLCVIW